MVITGAVILTPNIIIVISASQSRMRSVAEVDKVINLLLSANNT